MPPGVSHLSGIAADKTQLIHFASIGLFSSYLILHSLYVFPPLFHPFSLFPLLSLYTLLLSAASSSLVFPHHSHLFFHETEAVEFNQETWQV